MLAEHWLARGNKATSMPQTTHLIELIGNTPLVELRSLDAGLCRLLVKLENHNPGGSIKDRIGRSMIEAAEREEKIGPGSTLGRSHGREHGPGIGPGRGPKGLPSGVGHPRQDEPREGMPSALGGRSRDDAQRRRPWPPAILPDLAERIAAETPASFYVNQFNNPANPLAHEMTTAPEIWEHTAGQVDAVVCGVGSGGTLTGLSRFFNASVRAWR